MPRNADPNPAEPHSHDWRGQQQRDEWNRTCISLFVCHRCGATFQPGGQSRWLERCPQEAMPCRE